MRQELLNELSKAIKEEDECQRILGMPYSDAHKWQLRLERARGRTSGIHKALEIYDARKG